MSVHKRKGFTAVLQIIWIASAGSLIDLWTRLFANPEQRENLDELE